MATTFLAGVITIWPPASFEKRMDEPSANHPARLPALVAGFAALYLLWGSTFLGIKFAVESIPPLLMAAGRFLLAGTALYAVLRLRGAAAPTAAQWRGGAVT